MLYLWPHADPMNDANKKGMCFHLPYFSKRGCMNWYRSQKQGLKAPSCLTVSEHTGIGKRCDVCFPGWDKNVCMGCHVSVELWVACSYRTVWSTGRRIGVPSVMLLCKDNNPKGLWHPHVVESNKHKSPGIFEKPIQPMFSFWNIMTNVERIPN